MKTIIIVLGVCMTVNSLSTYTPAISYTQQETPAYAKWGKLAMTETIEKYPKANIIDYLYEGTEYKEKSTIVKFKLWLREDDNEFGVLVRIEYMNETEKVVKIDFQETAR